MARTKHEQERQRALGAERSAMFVEVAAHVGDCALVIVSGSLDNYGDSVGAVSFVYDLLVIARVFFGSFLDGTLYSVFRHVGGLGVLHERTQTRVCVRIRSAGLGGYRDLLADTCERTAHIAPTLELAGLAVFKCSSHL